MKYLGTALEKKEEIQEAAEAFCIQGTPVSCGSYGSGHINDTFLLCTQLPGPKERHYILQRMNTTVFADPEGLMNNVEGVTEFLRDRLLKMGRDPERGTLTLVTAHDGKYRFVDSAGEWWRMYLFIEDALSLDSVEEEEDFYQSAKAFGNFQRLLADYPVEKLTETIPDFHNTPKRYEALCAAIQNDICGRVSEVAEEIGFVRERKEELSVIVDALESGKIPYRVTHNDTKLNNVLLDAMTRQALCVIDLDTVMPGSALYDYGDSIRFGANTAPEDEQEQEKVSLSLSLFECYTKGFLEGCAGSLTAEEIRLLPWGAKLMTLECGIRFLTDYLENDCYFKIHRPAQNLDRARTQFALVRDMEKKWEQMNRIVTRLSSDNSAASSRSSS
jgi:hypothetical protein